MMRNVRLLSVASVDSYVYLSLTQLNGDCSEIREQIIGIYTVAG
jgi:hypothetical protein